jgi:predicted  nucleic acid-binding Zn-ribbon protein
MSAPVSSLLCHCGTKFEPPPGQQERRVNCPSCGAVIFLAAPKSEEDDDDGDDYGIKSHDEKPDAKEAVGVDGIPDWLEHYRSSPQVKKADRDKTMALLDRLTAANPTLDPLGATLYLAATHADAETSVAALTKVAISGHPTYAQPALTLLEHVGTSDAAGAQQVLLLLLEARDPAAEQVVVKVLQSLGPTPIVHVRKLIDLLGSRHAALYLWAVQCLRLIGPPAKRSVESLLKSLKIANQPFQLAVLDALAAIGGDAERVVPVLMQTLQHESPDFRAHAAQALGALGAAASKALPQLQAAVTDADEVVRLAASTALPLISAAAPAPPAAPATSPATFTIVCSCGKRLKGKAELVGKKVKCPACDKVMIAQAPPAPVAVDRAPASPAAAPVAEKECPTCLATVPGAAVLCVCCGFDFRKI